MTDKHYSEIAVSYDALYSLLADGYRKRFRIFRAIYDNVCPGHAPQNILDLGGGTGMMVPFLSENFGTGDITVADFSKDMLAVSTSKGYKTAYADMNKPETFETLTLENNGKKFDMVFTMGSLHHCVNLKNLFEAIVNHLLNENGVVLAVLNDQCKFPSPKRLFDEETDLYRKTRAQIDHVSELPKIKLLHKAIFEVPEPWSIPTEKYKVMLDGQFITRLHDSTEEEMTKFYAELDAKDSVVFENRDWLFVFQRE